MFSSSSAMTAKVTVTLKQTGVIRRAEGRDRRDCVSATDYSSRGTNSGAVEPWLLPTLDLFSDTATGWSKHPSP